MAVQLREEAPPTPSQPHGRPASAAPHGATARVVGDIPNAYSPCRMGFTPTRLAQPHHMACEGESRADSCGPIAARQTCLNDENLRIEPNRMQVPSGGHWQVPVLGNAERKNPVGPTVEKERSMGQLDEPSSVTSRIQFPRSGADPPLVAAAGHGVVFVNRSGPSRSQHWNSDRCAERRLDFCVDEQLPDIPALPLVPTLPQPTSHVSDAGSPQVHRRLEKRRPDSHGDGLAALPINGVSELVVGSNYAPLHAARSELQLALQQTMHAQQWAVAFLRDRHHHRLAKVYWEKWLSIRMRRVRCLQLLRRIRTSFAARIFHTWAFQAVHTRKRGILAVPCVPTRRMEPYTAEGGRWKAKVVELETELASLRLQNVQLAEQLSDWFLKRSCKTPPSTTRQEPSGEPATTGPSAHQSPDCAVPRYPLAACDVEGSGQPLGETSETDASGPAAQGGSAVALLQAESAERNVSKNLSRELHVALEVGQSVSSLQEMASLYFRKYGQWSAVPSRAAH